MPGNVDMEKQRVLRYWCQFVLPAVYDDSLSYYELLCKVVRYLNENVEAFNRLVDKVNMTVAELEELRKAFEKFLDGGFDSYFQKVIEKWIAANLSFIFKTVVKQVYFGLTDDGYFVAYIPNSWDDIVFDTGMDYSLANYGCLILRWETASPHTVNQLGETAVENPHGIVWNGGR